jgi:hypothetical protein
MQTKHLWSQDALRELHVPRFWSRVSRDALDAHITLLEARLCAALQVSKERIRAGLRALAFHVGCCTDY